MMTAHAAPSAASPSPRHAPPPPPRLPRVLCVDDDPLILEILRRQLRDRYEVTGAGDLKTGTHALRSQGPFAALVCDWHLPDGDGITLLGHACEESPDTGRILLTGFVEIEGARGAINRGGAHRFLVKPCDTAQLLEAVGVAVAHYAAARTERELQERTRRGALEALAGVLAISNPAEFGRAQRIARRAAAILDVVDRAGAVDRGLVQTATTIAQLCTRPAAANAEPAPCGASDPQECAACAADHLLASIPCVEQVREVIRYQRKHFDGSGPPADGVAGEAIPLGARALLVAADIDSLESDGLSAADSLSILRDRKGRYDPRLLDAFELALGAEPQHSVHELPIASLRPGLVLIDDLRTRNGLLIVARGTALTPGLIVRVREFQHSRGVREPVRVREPVL